MARHRNVRGYNYDEDFEEDDLYGHSVEDDYCISPSTAAQFIYSRRANPSALTETLEEEYGCEDKEHSNCISSHELTGIEKAQLESCLKHMREVLGESVPEKVMVEAVLNSKFDVQQALDSVLPQGNNQNMKTKDTVISGKAAKDLFCSEIYSNVNKLSNLVGKTSDSFSACFSLSDPVARCGTPCDPLAPSDKILSRSRYVKKPSVKKEILTPSSKFLGVPPLPVSDTDILFHDSLNKRASRPLVDDSSISSWSTVNASGSLSSSKDEVLKDNPSEKGSWNQSEEDQDLKTLLRLNETGDSADAQDVASVFFQKKSDDSKSSLDSPPGLITLRDTMLDNKMMSKFTRKMEPFGNIHSLSQKKSSSQGHKCNSLEFGSIKSSLPESPSLADLLQEHQSNNSHKTYPFSDRCNLSVAGFTDMELCYSPLSQLAGQPQISSGMTELSGSLSSLTFSKSSPVKELESLSLSDLIAKSIDVVKPETVGHSERADKITQPAGVNSDIDLSILIRKSTLSEHEEVKSDSQLSDTKVSCPTQQILVAKGDTKSKKRPRSCILEGTVPWTKTLSARPSAFALTLCLHYPSKRCKRGTVCLHKAFLYSRQMQEVTINETGPLLAITPFDFKSPSPDDIVKAGQKKAFTR